MFRVLSSLSELFDGKSSADGEGKGGQSADSNSSNDNTPDLLPNDVELGPHSSTPLHFDAHKKSAIESSPSFPSKLQTEHHQPHFSLLRHVHDKYNNKDSKLHESVSMFDGLAYPSAPQLLVSRVDDVDDDNDQAQSFGAHSLPLSPLDASSAYNPVLMSMNLQKQQTPGTPMRSIQCHLLHHNIFSPKNVVVVCEGITALENLFSPKKCRIMAVFVPYRHKAVVQPLVAREPVSIEKVRESLLPGRSAKSQLTFALDNASVPGDYLIELFFNDNRQVFADCTSQCDNGIEYHDDRRPNFIRYEPHDAALPQSAMGTTFITPQVPSLPVVGGTDSKSEVTYPCTQLLEQLQIEHQQFFTCREEIMKTDYGSMFAIDLLTFLVCAQSSPVVRDLEKATGLVIQYFAPLSDVFRFSLLMHLAARNLNHVIDVMEQVLSPQELRRQLLHVDTQGRDAIKHSEISGNHQLQERLRRMQQEKADDSKSYLADQNFILYTESHMDQLSSLVSTWIDREIPNSGRSTPNGLPSALEIPLSQYSFQI